MSATDAATSAVEEVARGRGSAQPRHQRPADRDEDERRQEDAGRRGQRHPACPRDQVADERRGREDRSRGQLRRRRSRRAAGVSVSQAGAPPARRAGMRAGRSRCRTAPTPIFAKIQKSAEGLAADRGSGDPPGAATAIARAASGRTEAERRPRRPSASTSSSCTPRSSATADSDRDRGEPRRLEGGAPEAPARVHHDREHHRLQAGEDVQHRGQASVADVGPRERPDDRDRGQDERGARDEEAAPARAAVAEVDGELGRVRPGMRCVAATRSRNASRSSQARRRTTSSSIIAMWAAGPPKAVAPRRRNSQNDLRQTAHGPKDMMRRSKRECAYSEVFRAGRATPSRATRRTRFRVSCSAHSRGTPRRPAVSRARPYGRTCLRAGRA